MTTIHTRQLTTTQTKHLQIQHVQKVNNAKVRKYCIYLLVFFPRHIVFTLSPQSFTSHHFTTHINFSHKASFLPPSLHRTSLHFISLHFSSSSKVKPGSSNNAYRREIFRNLSHMPTILTQVLGDFPQSFTANVGLPQNRNALFWFITQRVLVISYRRFEP